MEKKQKNSLLSIGRHLTSIVSVALVLLILGIIGALAIATRNITDSIKENLGFSLSLIEEAAPDEIDALKLTFDQAPYVASYEYRSSEEILAYEESLLGVDIVETLGVNPYPAEFDVKVKAQYASTDSITKIASSFESLPEVTEVTMHSQMVDDINANIHTLTMILIAVAVALLIISFVLINNTVRLTIYSQRFLLHTMRLVGATAAFIRRPIMVSNIINGLIAAVLAIAMLCGLRAYAVGVEPEVNLMLPWSDLMLVFAGIIVGGAVICALASIFATNKYLRQSYDDMF